MRKLNHSSTLRMLSSHERNDISLSFMNFILKAWTNLIKKQTEYLVTRVCCIDLEGNNLSLKTKSKNSRTAWENRRLVVFFLLQLIVLPYRSNHASYFSLINIFRYPTTSRVSGIWTTLIYTSTMLYKDRMVV